MLMRLPTGVLCIYALKVVSPNTRAWADEAVSASTLADRTELSLEGGMGLAYVKTLVNHHGGCIWCESEAGIGGIFSITFSQNTMC